MTVQQFLNDLGIDLAAEMVGENPDLPVRFQVPALTLNFRIEFILSGPYRSEGFFVSVADIHGTNRYDPADFLALMAERMREYRADPTPEGWCMRRGWLEVPDDILEKWDTFERDERLLQHLFGADYERFLALEMEGN